MRKFTLILSLLVAFVTTAIAQTVVEGQMYRIKDNTRSKYLTVGSYDQNSTGTHGTVPVIEKAEGNKDQVWYFESTGTDNQYYLKSKSNYYIVCRAWNVDANSIEKSAINLLDADEEGSIYLLNGTKYFKVEDIDGTAHPFCDAPADHANIVTWSLETVDESEFAAVSMDEINADYNAAKTYAQSILDRNLASAAEIEALNNALSAAETAYNALVITDNTISDADATTFLGLVGEINTATDNARFLTSFDEMSNNLVYSVISNGRGSWVSNGTAITGTTKAGIEVDITSANQQFAIIKSENTGKYYMYNLGAEKFVIKSGNYTVLTESPEQAVTLLTSTSSTHKWVIALVNDDNSYSHMGVSNGYDPAVITFYNDVNDAGNQSRIELVSSINEETLNAIEALIATAETDNTNAVAALDETIAKAEAMSAYIGTGVGKYTYTGEGSYEEKFAAIVAFREAIAETTNPTPAEVEAKTAELEAIIASFSLNMPVAGKYYRIKSKVSGLYVTAPSNTGTAMIMESGANANNIFYWDNDKHFLVYGTGMYINGKNHAHYGYKDTYTFEESKTGVVGAYTIKPATANYWHDNGTNLDVYSGATHANCNWIIEEVTELPVTVSIGYATLYAPVALAIPEGVTAHTVTLNGEWATLSEPLEVIPANTGVVLQAEANTYNFAITTADEFNGENDLNGSIAKTLVTKDENKAYYILAVVNEVAGFYNPTNGTDNTKFYNGGHKAYIAVDGAAQSNSVRFGEGTTGIENVTVENGFKAIYDLTGRRVESATAPGIYIVNGKKVLVK